MPLYDLNVAWGPDLADTQRTLTFLHELGYNVVALTHTISGKISGQISCAIPDPLPFPVPPKLQILRRCTMVLSDPTQNSHLSSLAACYDILALRPTNEKSLQQACQSQDCDILSLDLTQRFETHYKIPTFTQAAERGIMLEINYAPSIAATESHIRRTLISNATSLIRAARSRGIIISSGASTPRECRGPADVINLAAVWGLGQDKGKEAISKLARTAAVTAQFKKTSYRGVIDFVKTDTEGGSSKSDQAKEQQSKKRKATTQDESREASKETPNRAKPQKQQKR